MAKGKEKTKLNKKELLDRLVTIQNSIKEQKVLAQNGESISPEWLQKNVDHLEYVIRQSKKLIAVI